MAGLEKNEYGTTTSAERATIATPLGSRRSTTSCRLIVCLTTSNVTSKPGVHHEGCDRTLAVTDRPPRQRCSPPRRCAPPGAAHPGSFAETLMFDFKWSESEKKIARQVFRAALDAELAQLIADFKARAAAATAVDDLWSIQEHLYRVRREIDIKYDYRYSQLPLVFGRLLRESRIQEADLAGLADDKIAFVRRVASL